MPTNYRYITVPDNCINESQFFADVVDITERCICGSALWPGLWHEESSVFTDTFRNWLASYNCHLFKAEAFLVLAGKALAWHVDSNDDPDDNDLDPNLTAKINFMWGGDLSKCFMEYGQLLGDPGKGIMIVQNKRGRLCNVYDPRKTRAKERFSLEKTVLINRGVVHRVTNESDSDWYCLSCIIQSSDTGKPLKFADALKRFESVCMG
jgi:hypothetical protein